MVLYMPTLSFNLNPSHIAKVSQGCAVSVHSSMDKRKKEKKEMGKGGGQKRKKEKRKNKTEKQAGTRQRNPPTP